VRTAITIGAAALLLFALTVYCVDHHGEAIANELAAAIPRPELPPDPSEPSIAVYPSGDAVYVDGSFPSKPIQDALIEAVRKAYPGKTVRNASSVAVGAIARGWLLQLPAVLGSITRLSDANLAISGERAHLTGTTETSELRSEVESGIRQILGHGDLISDVALRTRTDHAQIAISAFLEANIIEFESSSSTLTAGGRNTVLAFASLLARETPTIQLDIEGHTDNSGTVLGNRRLSLDRANAVQAVLLETGIPLQRMSTHGYGSERPLEDNTTDEGKRKNRRIEIHVR
jgi:OmpA-OmpF porin, OOP family